MLEANMNEIKRLVVAENVVVTLAFSLTVDGEVIENTADSEPIQYLHGYGQILPALEAQLNGMAVGESKQVRLQPDEGYGDEDPEAYSDIPRGDFPKDIPLKLGVELQLKDEEGETHYARIEAVDPNHVRLNFNHALAGKELLFDVRIVALRSATQEELEHGHPHLGHEHE
jgi:FKBP-type peptidyl-prolyl cis-trans isomerase SlyD